MKVLIVAPYAYNHYHFETDLELAQCHLDAGDHVTLLACNAHLAACDINIDHLPGTCLSCISRRRIGVRKLSSRIEVLPMIRLGPKDSEALASARTTFSDLDDLKSYNFRSFDVGYAVLSSLVSQTRNPYPSLAQQAGSTRRLVLASLSVFLSVGRLLINEDFDRVYVFNGRFAPLRAVLRACQERGVDCFLHDRGSTIEKYALYENCLPHEVKKTGERIQLAWDTASDSSDRCDIASRFFSERASGISKNWVSFVNHQEQGRLPNTWNPDNHNVVIYTSSEDEMVAISDEWQNPIYRDQVDGLERIVAGARGYPGLSVFIRMHPNLRNHMGEDVKRAMALHGENIEVIPADSKVNSYDLLLNADRVLTFGSSIGIEATYWGKPSILAGNCFYRGLGSTYNPTSHDELMNLLTDTIEPLDKLGALKFGYYMATLGVSFRHYQPTGLFEGRFRGNLITPGVIARLVEVGLRTSIGRLPRSIIRSISLLHVMRRAPRKR